MKAIGLCRVSTDDQEEEGVSLDAQESKIRAYCKLYDIELVAIFYDIGSGKNMDREGLQKALQMLREGQADGIVVAKLDRLTRNVGDFQCLISDYFGEKAGFTLCSVDQQINTLTANGRMVLNIIMSVFQWERETISERTKDGLRHKKAKGERVGSVPYGKDLAADGVTLVDNAVEQHYLEWMKHLRKEGDGCAAIARWLNEQGVSTKKAGQIIGGKPVSGKWTAKTVTRILQQGAPGGGTSVHSGREAAMS